jgi:hypothetical protein
LMVAFQVTLSVGFLYLLSVNKTPLSSTGAIQIKNRSRPGH